MVPSENRPRLSVDLSASWKIYTNTIPQGSRALGTVTRGIGDTGALILIEATGIYAQVNAGALRTLDQRKIVAAVAEARSGTHGGAGRGQGRKTTDGTAGLERKNVSLDAETIATLTDFGDGELSLGIRRAAARIRAIE